MPMNILHIIPSLAWERGGPSAVVRALAVHQAAAGHSVAVLTTNQGARHGGQAIDLGPGILVRQENVFGPDRIAFAPGFSRFVRAEMRRADLVHIHSIFTNPVHVGLREAREVGVPTILRPCGQLHRYSLGRSRWQKQIYLKLWGRLVREACSAWHYTSNSEAAGSWPWDASPRYVLPNGIEPDEFDIDREEARRRLVQQRPEIADSPYVLFLGRIHGKKRLDLLLEAFVASAPRRFKLVVAGPDEESLWQGLARRFLATSENRSQVIRYGTVTGREKVDLLAGASLFALPSEHENFCIAALEALAVGTPVLLSPHVDLTESASGQDFIHTASLDVSLWRDKLSSLLGDSSDPSADSERARVWVRDNFSWGYLSRQLIRRYEWVIAGCPHLNGSASASAALPASRSVCEEVE
jgi:glycosyltransferase involved in cell wall biosynthesis